jgi:ketosteroid isomerase-like protein
MKSPKQSMLRTAGLFVLGLSVGIMATYAVMRGTAFTSAREDAMPYADTDLSQTAARWQQTVEARDGEALAAFFAEDTTAMYPVPAPTMGREANRQVWTAVFQPPDFVHPITIDEVVESEQGDLGYTFGRWWAIQPSAGQHAGGRFVAVWQPINGHWQIIYLSANAHDDIAAAEPVSQ